MNKLFEEFSKPSYTDWLNQLTKDLKGQPAELIQRIDEVEELEFNSYQHQDSDNTTPVDALNNVYTSQTYRATNAWENLATIIVSNEVTANKKALEMLNLGATALRFDVSELPTLDWATLTKDIQLEFIETSVKFNKKEQFNSIISKITDSQKSKVNFELDVIENKEINASGFTDYLKQKQTYLFLANGYPVQQAGATTWQELAFSISAAHETLVQLIDNGLTVDQAAACIHFNCGSGATYFYEIAKVRALRILWSRILEEYQPQHACTYNTKITAMVGHTNKSLKDPYTNLLRQTTEAMSMAFAGVHAICVLPYDSLSSNGATSLSTRMAVNIPLILQEESFLDKVMDPLQGSYTVEHLTNEIASKAWTLFQEIEKLGGISNPNALDRFAKAVQSKAELRKSRIAEKKDTLIGINIFPNPTEENNTWLANSSYLGMPQLILEQSI